MIWIRLTIILLVVLMAIYYAMVILQCFNFIKITRRKMTFARLLVPFYYWLAPVDEKQKNENPPTGLGFIRFAGNLYAVYDKKTLPGGLVSYKIMDEDNHFDWINNPEEIIRDGQGGYGEKKTGNKYPTKTKTN